MSVRRKGFKDDWWEWYKSLNEREQEDYWASLFPDQEELLGKIKQAIKSAREENNGHS